MRPPQPQQQDAPPPDPSVTLSKFSGLKNTVEAERLTQEELEIAINVDIDDAGQIHRRRGRTRVSTGNFSSLYTTSGGYVLAVKNGNLGIINPNYSFRALAAGFPTDPLAYVEVGPTIYFSSRTRAGKIDLNAFTVSNWGTTPDLWLSPVVNPTATLPPIRGRLLGKPPLATILGYYNGRIYLATGRTVWATELFLYDYVDKTRTYWFFEADVTMLGVVSDGIYVGTTSGLYFLTGPTFDEMKRTPCGGSGVIPGSMAYIPQEVANAGLADIPVGRRQDTDIKVSIMFLTHNGLCGGEDGGVTYNFTEDKFVFPTAESAVGAFRRQQGVNQYLAVTNSGGSPAASARIGDYVDATIVRGGGRWSTVKSCMRFGDSAEATIV